MTFLPDSKRRKFWIDSAFVAFFAITGEIYINSDDILGCSGVDIKKIIIICDDFLKIISGKELKTL
jgi:hypothetical protein